MAKEKGCAIREVVHEQAFEKHLKQLAKERDANKKFNRNKGSWKETKERMKNEKK